MAYQRKQHVIRVVFDLMEGKREGLCKKNYKILRFIADTVLWSFYKFLGPIMTISISSVILIWMYYYAYNYNVNYNPVIHFIWAIYYCFVVYQMISTFVIIFGLIIGFSLYIKLRFKQVNQLFKNRNLMMISLGVVMHKSLCEKVEQVNNVFSFHLTVFCLVMTLGWDIAFYLTLYGHNPVIRIVMANCSVWLLFGSFFAYCSGALFTSEAHKPYELINSLMVKRNLCFKRKWKVSFSFIIILLRKIMFLVIKLH